MKPDEVKERIRMAAARQSENYRNTKVNHKVSGERKEGFKSRHRQNLCYICGSTDHFKNRCPVIKWLAEMVIIR